MAITESIQGVEPQQVVRASDAASFIDAIRSVARAGQPIVNYGQFHRGLGHTPPEQHIQIYAPAGVEQHYIADMTVRVAAGTPIRELQAALERERQFLPIDAPDDMSIGEVVAHNVSGPLRVAHGTTRDLMLGLTFVNADGETVKVGGRTVKNVAGYDVTRMMVGNLNTLGLLGELTLRTTAIPERVAQFHIAGVDPVDLDTRITALLTGDAAPWYLMAQTSADNEGRPHTIVHLAFAGSPAACDAQHEALRQWLSDTALPHDGVDRRDTDTATDATDRAAHSAWREDVEAHVKIVVPPAETGRVTRTLLAIEPQPWTIDTLPAFGVVHLGAEWDTEQAREADRAILDTIAPHAGFRVWMRRPSDTADIAPWAPPQPDWPMLARLKQAMDPNGVFNPGRFP